MACSRPAPPPAGAFEPSADFAPLSPPQPGDWLEQRPEKGQTFERFVASKPHRPDARRDRLYLQPLGEFPPGSAPPFNKLREFMEAFFAMEVVIRPPLDLSQENITSRRHPYQGHRQRRAGDLLHFLGKRLPPDAYALLGFTMEDLYPSPDWNFVFGMASMRNGVGVSSFVRYDPRFYGDERPPNWEIIMLRRSCKVLAHETAHMFAIAHCTSYRCLINGSNSLEELDQRPFDLCPVDLRKLHHSIGFDVVDRYERLLDFTESAGLAEEAAWYRRRIAHLTQ